MAQAPARDQEATVETITLDTDRLILEWMTREMATSLTTATSGDDWGRGFPTSGELTVAKRVLEETTIPAPPFHVYLMRERASGLLIGGAGFHAPPANRMVEFGYGLARAYQGYGYATEASGALVEAAFATGEIDQIVATTEPDNLASQGVLTRLAFTRTNDAATHWTLSRP
jgi:RimJ/RimL family protein N-acetyltransferase